MPTTRSRSIPRAASLEGVRKKIIAAIEKGSIEELSKIASDDVSRLLGSTSVRLFQRDALTGELFSQFNDGRDLKELRIPADPSSPTGYAAMTRNRSFAW